MKRLFYIFILAFVAIPVIYGFGPKDKRIPGHFKLDVTKDKALGCVSNKLFNKDSVFAHPENILSASIDIISYYFDKMSCSGLCFYYTYAERKGENVQSVRWLDGRPCYVLIILNNKQVLYFTGNTKENAKKMARLKALVPALPDSVANDSNILHDNVTIQD